MLNQIYSFCTPWAVANKRQIMKNRILGRIVNYIYPMWCKITSIKLYQMESCDDTVISLTSFPARINKVHLCVQSLLRQDMKPNKIILWLAEEQFPDKKIPNELENLCKYGLEIRYCKDYRSYKKIFKTIELFTDKNIVIADDDALYPEDWLRNLINTAKANPDCVVCYRARLITLGNSGMPTSSKKWDVLSKNEKGPSHLLAAVGVGGAYYPKDIFKNTKFNFDEIYALAPTSDDYWLKIFSLKKGYKTVKVKENSIEWFTIFGSQKTSLTEHNIQCGQDDVLVKLLRYYNINFNKT